MVKLAIFQTLLAASLATTALAHGGNHELHLRTHAKRAGFYENSKRALQQCAQHMKARGIEQTAIERRQALAQKLSRRSTVLQARNSTESINTDHETNLTGVTIDTEPSVLFSGNISCMLVPEVTQGPYCKQYPESPSPQSKTNIPTLAPPPPPDVDGEFIREDLREDQEGVDTYIDVQIIDTNTCEPLTGAYIDFWHANATGVYSGVVASGNGNSNDATNVNNTFLRGIQPTGDDGVAEFLTVFPGHYTSRATHIHVLVHQNGTVLPNNTYSGGTVSEVGQLFFDQDLINKVEKTTPYSTNTQNLTENTSDQILEQEAEDDFDPIVEYTLLGDDISDGILGWISFGVNASAAYEISAAATLYASGGVMDDDSSSSSPGGGNSSAAPSS
ncbi:MAG: hypothetical protein M1834_002931 [Cirrosporium novae-zelandiae]|nr:MAG: hypothetical protein M1834_002931 [Cirrosporium novae-zelandiae]